MASKLSERMKSSLSTTRGKVIFIVALVVIVGGLFTLGFLLYQSYKYVTTDNARISAPLIAVPALTSSQIISLEVDLGSYVQKGDRIALMGVPRPDNPADRLGLKDVPLGRASLDAPVSGYVAAVWSYPGQVVSPGASVVTLYDVSNTWITANVTEAELHRIQPGQEVEVTVDSLGGARLKGKVDGIAAATAATFSLMPQNNTTGNFIKVAQVVPVKISVENPNNYVLIPGTSVEVKITTR
ncbi:MAG: efflux RND transporter periplasmic adaptor subunit [Dehalococcoidia bacterium]